MKRFNVFYTDVPDSYLMQFEFKTDITKVIFLNHIKKWINETIPKELSIIIDYFEEIDFLRMANMSINKKVNINIFSYISCYLINEINQEILIDITKTISGDYRENSCSLDDLFFNYSLDEELNEKYKLKESLNYWMKKNNIGRVYKEKNIKIISF